MIPASVFHSIIVASQSFHRSAIRAAFFFCVLLSSWQTTFAQLNTDNQYSKPLKEVLNDVQKKYGVTIKFVDSMVKNKMVTYAEWKYRPDVEVTLDNILKPLELKVKKEKDKQYKLSAYEYYRWPVEEGWAEMDRIAAQYKTVEDWEKRKAELKPCLKEALQLNYLPAAPNSKPIVTAKRIFDGYSVENIAIEILPGVWINGSLYKPLKFKGKIPVILNPDGHWEKQRYRADCQYRCAAMAKMGAMAFSYDLFAWGESLLQFKVEDHRRSLAMTIQALGAIRILDYLLAQKDADTNRVAITGGSGGGSHTVLMTALDDRIKVSAPVVSLSSYFYGGCPCESGMNIHACGGRTNNVEIAAMAAPRPQLVVSDGGDWTDKMPEHDFPYLQTMYRWYNKKENVSNVHLPNDKHDFGITKRTPVYEFMAKQLGLNIKAIQDANGKIDESKITIEPEKSLYVFGDNGEKLPAHAVKGFENLERVFAEEIEKARTNQRYKIGLIDLMLLKRQKLGAITLTAELKADGVEVDMGGLGNRPTFDNQLLIDSVRNQFIQTAKDRKVEIFCLAMTGYYAQSFCGRAEYIRSIEDCIKTMQLMNVKHAFLPLGVQCDIKKNPAIRDSVIARLRVAGKLAEEAGVIIGIETSLTAKEEVELLKRIGSPAIKIYFNFSNPLKEGRDLISEIKILGKDRISMIHATNKDSVWLENDPQIDLYKVKKTLDEIGWSGWLVIERSRDARKPSDTRFNYGANTAYLKKVFQE
ncbi:sugar phosphate isomerase/epimerase family protein [Lacibacter sp.]|uniref:sugar phosphate isomerase/epimerase family protein n=1 Tax=Lacibacter sp. TaxID=1915409 RepID=UPI002B4AAEEE|nr:sugar phosphate isomerase/epimerase family protein [Lacibacter sp.]HLP38223.1 sugar phosphate isomerase/epimerase family protein [Lacibacter sp.]